MWFTYFSYYFIVLSNLLQFYILPEDLLLVWLFSFLSFPISSSSNSGYWFPFIHISCSIIVHPPWHPPWNPCWLLQLKRVICWHFPRTSLSLLFRPSGFGVELLDSARFLVIYMSPASRCSTPSTMSLNIPSTWNRIFMDNKMEFLLLRIIINLSLICIYFSFCFLLYLNTFRFCGILCFFLSSKTLIFSPILFLKLSCMWMLRISSHRITFKQGYW